MPDIPSEISINDWYANISFKMPDDSYYHNDNSEFLENIPRDRKSFLKSVHLKQYAEGTYVVVLAICKDYEFNVHHSIPASYGNPINVGVYDLVCDCYHVECVGFCELGRVPINYKLSFDSVYNYELNVPMPLPLILKYLDDKTLEDFNAWKSTFEDENYFFETIQLIDVY